MAVERKIGRRARIRRVRHFCGSSDDRYIWIISFDILEPSELGSDLMGNVDSANKKRLFQNDLKLVFSMFAFYGLCIIGLIALLFWGLFKRNQTISANATATAGMIATQQVNATATAVAHTTELSQYKFIDTFDSNKYGWRIGDIDSEYWEGKTGISSGVYAWDVYDAKDGFISWADSPMGIQTTNYDTYADINFGQAVGKACGGFIFHLSPSGWEVGGYIFYICRSGRYSFYYRKADDWEELRSGYSDLILPNDWNRMEVLARDPHFVFLVNSQVIFEIDDDRRTGGDLALFIDIGESGTGSTILFDNFGFQHP